MSAKISPHAIIDPKAILHDSVEVGPWSIIGPDVEIGEGTIVGPHVVIKGPTKIGRENHFFQFSSIGEEPQDMKYKGEPTVLKMGDRNTVREYVSIHRGTIQDKGITSIGNENLFITGSHVAHDCVIGNNTIIGHNVGLGGHVIVEDFAIVTSYAAVHQFCRVGAHSFLARATMLVKDMLPYVMVAGGFNAEPVGINVEGLKRRGFTSDEVNNIRRAYKIIYREGLTVAAALEKLYPLAESCDKVKPMIESLETSARGIVR